MKVSIILPVYNGSSYIGESLSLLSDFCHNKFLDFQLIVVNDGSTDSSLDIIKKSGRLLKLNLTQISYDKNRGRGFAIKKAILSGVLKFEDVIILDSDLPLTIDLSQMVKAVEGLKTHDIVVMSRYHQDSKVVRKTHRRILSACHRFLVRSILPKMLSKDADVGFKAFKFTFLKECTPYTNLNRWSWDLQALIFASYNDYKIRDYPFHWIEEYEETTVRLLKDSLDELIGIFYIRWQLFSGVIPRKKIKLFKEAYSHDENN